MILLPALVGRGRQCVLATQPRPSCYTLFLDSLQACFTVSHGCPCLCACLCPVGSRGFLKKRITVNFPLSPRWSRRAQAAQGARGGHPSPTCPPLGVGGLRQLKERVVAIPASAQSIAVIQRVLEGSPAGEAGLQAGDLLLSVAGEAGGVTGCGEGGQPRAEGWGRGGPRRPI